MINDEFLTEVRRHSSRIAKNGDFDFEKSIFYSELYVGDCIRQLNNTFEQINKNLEKIANNTEKVHTTGYMRTELNKGEFYEPIKKELNLDTIICKQNKDSHVDKNIILD